MKSGLFETHMVVYLPNGDVNYEYLIRTTWEHLDQTERELPSGEYYLECAYEITSKIIKRSTTDERNGDIITVGKGIVNNETEDYYPRRNVMRKHFDYIRLKFG